MIVKYDSLNKLEKPALTLCNPGSTYSAGSISKIVGVLPNHEAEEIIFNFNATSELNFRINKITVNDLDENNYINNIYNSTQNRRLIFVDDIGYFMITEIEDGYSDNKHYKDVKAQSADIEIQQKMIPYIDGTYRFTTQGFNKGILETIVEVLPLWTIGHVDNSIASKFRTFEDIDTSLNCLSFLLENVQDAYECIILFDIKERTINVYDQENYVRRTSIHLTKDDVIKSLDIKENADDLYTAISAFGGENITIAPINPTGANTIYNFDYYLSWMSPSLSEKVSAWQNEIEQAKITYRQASSLYHSESTNISNIQMAIDALNTQITMYKRCRDNIIAEGNTSPVDIYNEYIGESGGTVIIQGEIEYVLQQIDSNIASCELSLDVQYESLTQSYSRLDGYKQQMDYYVNTLSIANYFTQEEYNELANYIFEGTYTDEYIIITDGMSHTERYNQMQLLYDRAEDRLKKVSQPTQEFSVDSESFIFEKEFEKWSEQLETGCLINVEIKQDDIAALFLSNITINYDDHNLSMTFGNRFNKFDPKSLFNNILGSVSKSANTLNYVKDVLYPIKSGQFNSVKESLQISRDLTATGGLSSSNEEVVIDSSGYTGKRLREDGEYDPRQIKINGKTILFTDDAWDSCKVAIGELNFGEDGETVYGINAEAIIGDIIIGHNLKIIDSEGNDIFSVVDNQISAVVNDTSSQLSDLSDSLNDVRDSVALCITPEELNIAISNISVDKVKTSMGYTFDNDGLTIRRSGNEIENRLDHTGMYVSRSGDQILTANNNGVEAINLTSKQYLIVGNNSRFENFSNGTDTKRTACFYIGNVLQEELENTEV